VKTRLAHTTLLVSVLLGATSLVAQRGRPGARRGRSAVETHEIAGLTVAVWRPAQNMAPVPLFSFRTGTTVATLKARFSWKPWPKQDILLMAPNHKDAICGGGFFERPEEPFQNPGAWNEATYKERGNDIVRLMDALCREE
jgi:hypothetical protein